MDTSILLVCQEGDSLAAYRAALDPPPIHLEVAHTIGALESTLVETPFNGLLLDMDTLFHATDQEKDAARALHPLTRGPSHAASLVPRSVP